MCNIEIRITTWIVSPVAVIQPLVFSVLPIPMTSYVLVFGVQIATNNLRWVERIVGLRVCRTMGYIKIFKVLTMRQAGRSWSRVVSKTITLKDKFARNFVSFREGC
jgi:hypothetical protein